MARANRELLHPLRSAAWRTAGERIVFSVFMGFFGGLLPAGRAAFTKITDALRQVG